MARLKFSTLVAVIVFTITGVCFADDEAERAESLFLEGNRAFAEGDYRAAYGAYREAWSLRKSFDIACNLGRTEAEIELSRDAAEHLDYCLRTFSASSRTEVKGANKRFRDLFTVVRARVGALNVQVRPSGAEVFVDGASYGPAPLERQVFVDPGRHRVRARLPGFLEEEREVDVGAGGTLDVALALKPVPARTATGAPAKPREPSLQAASREASVPAVRDEPRALQPRTIVLLSGAALTLVGLGVGFGFTLDAAAAGDRAADLRTSLAAAGGGCDADSLASDCTKLHDAVDREDLGREIAGAAFAAAGIASAATLAAWFIVPDRKTEHGLAPANRTTWRAAPMLSDSVRGLALFGTY